MDSSLEKRIGNWPSLEVNVEVDWKLHYYKKKKNIVQTILDKLCKTFSKTPNFITFYRHFKYNIKDE